jgi:hypothetical protein
MRTNTHQAKPGVKATRKKPSYFVDLIGFVDQSVEVDFTINNDDGHTEFIDLGTLTEFMNINWYDSPIESKRRVQGPGSAFRISYLIKHIYVIVEAYLTEKQIGFSIN